MSNLRTLAVVILAAIGNSLLAWQTLAARDYDEAYQTTEVNRQTDSPKIQDAAAPWADTSPKKTQPYMAAIEVRDVLTNAAIPDAHIECSYEEGAKVTATTDAHGTAQSQSPNSPAPTISM